MYMQQQQLSDNCKLQQSSSSRAAAAAAMSPKWLNLFAKVSSDHKGERFGEVVVCVQCVDAVAAP